MKRTIRDRTRGVVWRQSFGLRLSQAAIFAALTLLSLSGCQLAGIDSAGRAESVEIAEPNTAVSSLRPVVDLDAKVLLRRACAYLWSRQGQGGGWHSDKYAVLRSGQATTPFILHTLLTVPEKISPNPTDRVERALEFIRAHTSEEGVLGVADPDVLEYPNYATAYALRCLVRIGKNRDEVLAGRMRAYLIAEQYREENGFEASAPAFGGWGFGGPRPRGSPQHMDLAHTRRVLEALREACTEDAAAFERAQIFLQFVQRHPADRRPQPPLDQETDGTSAVPYDGGFYFSPVVLEANKGRVQPHKQGILPFYRSYATATCDGILALLAAGVLPNDERVLSARRWLENHPRLDYPEGIPSDHPAPWGDALHFYHLAVRAEVYAALNWRSDWTKEIATLVASRQRPDGSFVNTESHLMKEDDPLLCTALAVIALTHASTEDSPATGNSAKP